MTKIYARLKEKGQRFEHVCEVGVYLPETSNIRDFINDGVRTTLVEADPDTVAKIRAVWGDKPNVTVCPFAVWDNEGTLRFSKAASSTFATDLPNSPALTNDKHKIVEEQTFEVPCKRFSQLDDGSIDLLTIDIEGGEWYVLKHLVSKPRVLSIETHGKYYTNPFLNEINAWLAAHHYQLWYKDGSDSVYVLEGLLTPDFSDKWATTTAEWAISWKKFKRVFKKK